MHDLIRTYLDHLTASGKASTAATYGGHLERLESWAVNAGIDLADLTPDILARFQLWLANSYRTADNAPLADSTQASVIAVIRSWCRWLHRRGHLSHDPAHRLVPPKLPDRPSVTADPLSQQEAFALLATAQRIVADATPGSIPWAIAHRNLALMALAIATGRRVQGLCDLQVADIEFQRAEVRVSWEKGKAGRVLPAARWAIAAVRAYCMEARRLLLGDRTSPHLFVSQRIGQVDKRTVAYVLDDLLAATIAANPDLTDLRAKRITTHSLRATFATLLHRGGCSIRSINAMMLHASLDQTAQYTPVPLDDLRRAIVAHHPRSGRLCA